MAGDHLYSKSMGPQGALTVVDDLIRQRAEEEDQAILIAYPKTDKALSDYDRFSAGRIDNCVSNVVEKLIQKDLTWQTGAEGASSVVGLLGPSNFEYIINMFALVRLGYTVFLLSPRLSTNAYESLLEEAHCTILVTSNASSQAVDHIKQKRHVKTLLIIPKNDFDADHSAARERPGKRRKASTSQDVAFIMHSSGSTGLPKCIYLTHAACIHNFRSGYPLECFITVPLYHMHGHSSLYRAMYQRKLCYIYNAALPLTGTNLVTGLDAVRPQLLLTVPYGLKLLSESQGGISALRNCQKVSYAGSNCPDELGDYISACGVQLVSTFGLTEAGAILQTNRRDQDEPWNYLRIIPTVEPYTWMKPIGSGVCELVILDGLESKIASNSSNPPNSFHTKDLFVAHENISGSWKYIGRVDDRVTLVNGEKVLPLPIEGRIRQDRRIREAVVFGIGRAMPGLLLFRSDESKHLSDMDFVDAIWPAVEDANSKAERFSQIGKEIIISLPSTRQYPRTDKGTIIRARVYESFASEISAMYDRLESMGKGPLSLEIGDLRNWLLRCFRERLDVHLENTEAEFFAAGVDSLQAVRMVNIIREELFLNGKNPSTSAIYDTQNVEQLALYLHRLQTGTTLGSQAQKQVSDMTNMIETHSSFIKHVPVGPLPEKKSVLLTGATGFLGSYILIQLLQNQSVVRIYCPVRASSPKEARDRLLSTLSNRRFPAAHQNNLDKILVLPADTNPPLIPSFLEEEPHYTRLTHIIHCAWPVNFTLPFSTFTPHLCTLHELLQLSLSSRTPNPTHLLFISSTSSAFASPSATIPEAPLPSLTTYSSPNNRSNPTGYARSKYVAEKIIQNAIETAGAKASILRVGQIIGDTLHHGAGWPDSDAVPLMVRSALTTGALPALQEQCAWLPVDTAARTILDIADLIESNHAVTLPITHANNSNPPPTPLPAPKSNYIFNILSPHPFSWTTTFLPALQSLTTPTNSSATNTPTPTLPFQILPQKTWLARLRTSPPDPIRNPSIKLLDYWTSQFEPPSPTNGTSNKDVEGEGEGGVLHNDGREVDEGNEVEVGEGNEEAWTGARAGLGAGGKVFETGNARGKSAALREAPDVIGEGYVGVMVGEWVGKWRGEGEAE